MKKIVSIITLLIISFVTIFSVNVYAATLTGINATTTKTTMKPGENVTVDIEFGEELGAYTFEIAYDSNVFEYVSAEGGTANDTGSKVIVTFYDTTGGTSPRSNMSVTFKAKSVTTSTSANFSITASGLSNPDASVTYDDITTAIVKTVIVEPEQTGTTTPDNNTGEQGGTDEGTTQKPDEDKNQGLTGNNNNNNNNNTEKNEPTTMPQTGNMIYAYTIPTILVLGASYILIRKKN